MFPAAIREGTGTCHPAQRNVGALWHDANMRPNVLVIEANESDARAFASALSEATVEFESDAVAAAAKLVRGHHYDLVLCDLASRRDLSAEFSDALRKLSNDKETLLAIISDDAQEAEAYSDAGACVLGRPIRSDDLRALLDSASHASRP
jgi:CheY-like chemotaxis protein